MSRVSDTQHRSQFKSCLPESSTIAKAFALSYSFFCFTIEVIAMHLPQVDGMSDTNTEDGFLLGFVDTCAATPQIT